MEERTRSAEGVRRKVRRSPVADDRSAEEAMGKGTCVWLMTAKSDWRGEAVCAPKSSSRWVIAR